MLVGSDALILDRIESIRLILAILEAEKGWSWIELKERSVWTHGLYRRISLILDRIERGVSRIDRLPWTHWLILDRIESLLNILYFQFLYLRWSWIELKVSIAVRASSCEEKLILDRIERISGSTLASLMLMSLILDRIERYIISAILAEVRVLILDRIERQTWRSPPSTWTSVVDLG